MFKIREIVLLAPAKVNFFLHIVGKREDGYHNIYSLMQKLSLYDELRISIQNNVGVTFSCDDPSLPVDDTNLAVKAALAFMNKSKIAVGCGFKIYLKKRIPVAAGLGGGSSDAGAVLLGLNKICNDEFSEAELIELATPLGADVPFFVCEAKAALAEGIGEILSPVQANERYDYVLVNPNFNVSTKKIFESFSLTRVYDQDILFRPVGNDPGIFNINRLYNDLESVTCEFYPSIEEIKKDLQEAGASGTLMSGSGPTVFGVYENGLTAKEFSRVYEALSPKYGDKIFIAKAI
ncbi:MAG: 4-(cytidine 5'-diphospho)-2-C-methyl-D-erythritol kinase [Desulfotalea sp.]